MFPFGPLHTLNGKKQQRRGLGIHLSRFSVDNWGLPTLAQGLYGAPKVYNCVNNSIVIDSRGEKHGRQR